MRVTRVAVVGVGRMGLRHAEKARALARAGRPIELAGLVDIDAPRLASRCQRFSVAGARELAALGGRLDAVVIAAPTLDHAALARDALCAGLHVLVEKPIAATLAEAEQMTALAARSGCVLHVGHQEWWNPGLCAVRGELLRPRYAEVHRLAVASSRRSDVDVVRDLMIHDVEILQHLMGGPPLRVEARGAPVRSSQIDVANARLVFAGGRVANLTASRVARSPRRRMRLVQADACVHIDFLAQRAEITRRETAESGACLESLPRQSESEDALQTQLDVFLSALRGATGAPGVGATRATAALHTALRVLDAIGGRVGP